MNFDTDVMFDINYNNRAHNICILYILQCPKEQGYSAAERQTHIVDVIYIQTSHKHQSIDNRKKRGRRERQTNRQ